jgi:hypothetical protein
MNVDSTRFFSERGNGGSPLVWAFVEGSLTSCLCVGHWSERLNLVRATPLVGPGVLPWRDLDQYLLHHHCTEKPFLDSRHQY